VGVRGTAYPTVVPDDDKYLSAIAAANRGSLHLEARDKGSETPWKGCVALRITVPLRLKPQKAP
jgi:hypothetical protein